LHWQSKSLTSQPTPGAADEKHAWAHEGTAELATESQVLMGTGSQFDGGAVVTGAVVTGAVVAGTVVPGALLVGGGP
jgi:hypothetical protein